MSIQAPNKPHAELLYATLQKELSRPGGFLSKWLRPAAWGNVSIALEGAGVHWSVIVTGTTRSCQTHCFHQRKGPEFATIFMTDGQRAASGRSHRLDETIAAIKHWLAGATLTGMYEKYAFVDKEKRFLQAGLSTLMAFCPRLERTMQHEVVEDHFNFYSLWFRDGERACTLKIYSDHLNLWLFWDDVKMSQSTTGFTENTARLIEAWVVDKEMPSVLKKSYPDLHFDEVADYYEQGRPIEGEFIVSWKKTVDFYKTRGLENTADILSLIQTMLEKGFDHILHAGVSLDRLIISRGHRTSLMFVQPFLGITFAKKENAMEVFYKEESYAFDHIGYNATLDSLLQQLIAEPID